MTENEFLRQTQAAAERMREMNSRSKQNNSQTHKMPPIPSFVKVNNNENSFNNIAEPQTAIPQKTQKNKPPKNMGGFGIGFIDDLLKDPDSVLILGLLLILMSENSDKMLLFALIYILL